MAIIQISKIQQRSGNIVDLPQLDEAEFGWASDVKRLFIGKTTPNENVEVLTAYSTIAFSQIDGVVGNIVISNTVANGGTLDAGQVLAFNGTSWVNAGGDAGGLITLGNASNVKITGGATGFVLQTDGTGNLNWAPSGVLVSYIENVTQANPAVVTTTEDNFLVSGTKVTITNAQGMIDLEGQSYYANVLSANTFALYSDAPLLNPVDSTGYNAYSYTSVTATTVTTNFITVGNTAAFTLGQPVEFLGSLSNSGLQNNVTYYVANIANTTAMKVASSSDGNTANVIELATTSGLTANVYQLGGRAVSTFGGGSSVGVANGTSTMVQFNTGGLLDADADFTFDKLASPKLLTVNGNANVGNINVTSAILAGNVYANAGTVRGSLLTGTLTTAAQPNITSTGTLSSLTVTANVTAGNLVTGGALSVTGNANVGNLGTAGLIVATGNVAGGNLTTGGALSVTGNANVGNLGTGGLIIATGNITGGNLVTAGALSVTGNANVGNLGTAGLIVATGNVTGGNLVTSGALSVTGNANVGNIGTTNVIAGNVYANSGQVRSGNVTSLGYFYRSVATAQTAAGTVQSNAATFTTEIVEFSTVASGAGAILPAAAAGMIITIVNTGGNTLNVYPASGDTINSLATNAAYTQPAGATLQYVALDSSRWYTVGATFA